MYQRSTLGCTCAGHANTFTVHACDLLGNLFTPGPVCDHCFLASETSTLYGVRVHRVVNLCKQNILKFYDQMLSVNPPARTRWATSNTRSLNWWPWPDPDADPDGTKGFGGCRALLGLGSRCNPPFALYDGPSVLPSSSLRSSFHWREPPTVRVAAGPQLGDLDRPPTVMIPVERRSTNKMTRAPAHPRTF